MRVISQDKMIDTDYDSTAFYVVEDKSGDETKWVVATRSIDFRLYAPMGVYATKADAIMALKRINEAYSNDWSDTYYIPE